MNPADITDQLSINKNIFKEILSGLTEETYSWKPDSNQWCIMEVVCHLYDVERQDFRKRTLHVLETPSEPWPSIGPQPSEVMKNYRGQNFYKMVNNFLEERKQSVDLLKNLSDPKWNHTSEHPKFGKMTATMFLVNWLAHDYLHVRQIIRLKYEYLKHSTNDDLSYAGNW